MKRRLYLYVFAFVCVGVMWGGCSEPPTATEKVAQENTTLDSSERPEAALEADGTKETGPEHPAERSQPEQQREAPPEPLPDGQVETIESICTRITKATCAPLLQCCSKLSLRFKDETACRTALNTQCIQAGYQKEAAALKAGRLLVNQAQLQACEQAITTAGKQCQTASGPQNTATCKQILQDPAKPGELCKSDLGGAYCAAGKGVCFPTPTGTNCLLYGLPGEACSKAPCRPDLICTKPSDPAGTCEAPFGAGKACRISPQCQAGLACLNDVCSTQLPAGAACDNVAQCQDGLECDSRIKKCAAQVNEGSACEYPLHCKAGLVCHGLTSGLICQPQSKEGEPCSKKEHCTSGLGCVQNTCQTLPTESEACTKQNGCAGSLLCDLGTNKCAKAPVSQEPCIQGEVRCAAGLGCFNTSQGDRCQPKRDANGACEGPDSCKAGLGCGAAKTCEPLPTTGKACLGGFFCANGFFCDLNNAICAPYKKPGEPCPIGLECGPQQACIPDAAKIKRCAAIPKQDQACALVCAPGLACRPGLVAGRCIPGICNGALVE